MKAGWTQKPLGDVVALHYGKPLSRDERREEGKYPVFGANGIKAYSNKFLSKGPSIIIGRKGSAGEINLAAAPFWPLDVTYFTEHKSDQIDFGFLHYWLAFLNLPTLAKGVKPGINRNEVYALETPLPPLAEQKRIAAILDEAFAGLDRARAHTEANLQNARDLFESFLHTIFNQSNWGNEAKVSDSFLKTKIPIKIKRRKYLRDGAFPIVSQEKELVNGYWDNPDDLVELDKPIVVFGDHTRILKFIDFNFVVGADGTQLLCPKPEFDPLFYYYALKTIDLEGKGYARHFPHLKKESFVYPESFALQKEVSRNLKKMEEKLDVLDLEYKSKLADLDDLRQSLLQKAFAGELT